MQAPNCPDYPVGEFNGVWFYVTTDCAGQTGYGESLTYYEESQCLNGSCINPVAPVGIQDGTVREIPQEVIDGWIADVQSTIDRLNRAINTPQTGPDRRARMRVIMPFLNSTLTFLKSDANGSSKEQAYAEFRRELQAHQKAWTAMKFAPGPGAQVSVLLRDQPIPVELSNKTVAETKFNTEKVKPQQATVKPTIGPLLKLVPKAGADPIYFQCYTVEVTRHVEHGFRGGFGIEIGAPAPPVISRDTLSIGVQVKPTTAEAARAVNAEWSERGAYAHRLRGPGSRPWLVVGSTNLEP